MLPRLYLSPAVQEDISEAAFLGRRSAAGSIRLHVRRAGSICPEQNPRPRASTAASQCFSPAPSGLFTTILGIALVFFPAQQITSIWSVRVMDVRWHSILRRPGRIFLLCLRPPQRFERAQLQPRCAWTRTGAALAAGDNQIRTRTRLRSCHCNRTNIGP